MSLELLQSLLATINEDNFSEIINYCYETKIFYNENIKGEDIANFINSLFSKLDNKDLVLRLLQAFIPQCSRDILNSNIMAWIQLCNKTLLKQEGGSISVVSFQLLNELIRLSTNFQEVRKEIALSLIPKTLDHFIRELKSTKEDRIIVLECLEQVLDSYGKSCGLYKDEISTLLFSFLESSPQYVLTCAKCYLKLAACGSPGNFNEHYANNFCFQQKLISNQLHDLMDYLFENVSIHEIRYRRHDISEYNSLLPNVNERSQLRRKQRLATLFQSLVEFFCILLLGSFPALKKIFPQSALNLIWRGLSVNCSTLRNSNMSTDVSNLITVISKVNVASLKLLNALIISSRMNLVSHSSFISRIISQVLLWTNAKNWAYRIGKPHRSIRVEAYLCAANWCNISGVSSGIEKHIDELLSSIVSDVNIEPPVITLKVPSNNKEKGKKQKQRNDIPNVSELIVHKEENEDLCKAALDLVPSLLASSSVLMKPEQHKLFQKVIVRKLLQIQQKGLNRETPIPYSSKKCRLSLYKALLALCNNYHPSVPPPLNYAVSIFSKGREETSMKVVAFCIHAQSNIGKMLRPPSLSLEYPIINENLSYCNIGNESFSRKKNQKRNKSLVHKNLLDSTPNNQNVEDSTLPFLQNADEFEIEQSVTVIEPNESFYVENEHEALNDTVKNSTFSHISPPSCSKTFEVLNETEDREDSCQSQDISIVGIEPSDSIEKNFTFASQKKRELEEIDDAENSCSKKIKVNGVHKENMSVGDSEEEFLNMFVDEGREE